MYITARNLHSVFPGVIYMLFHGSMRDPSILEVSQAVTLNILRPDECVVFWEELGMNPIDELPRYLLQANVEDMFPHRQVAQGHYYVNSAELGTFDFQHLVFMSEVHRRQAEVEERPLSISIGKLWCSNTVAENVAHMMKGNNEDVWDPYTLGQVESSKIVHSPEMWASDLQMFSSGLDAIGVKNTFLKQVGTPMINAQLRLAENNPPGSMQGAADHLQRVKATDWKYAAEAWLTRRHDQWIALNGHGSSESPPA